MNDQTAGGCAFLAAGASFIVLAFLVRTSTAMGVSALVGIGCIIAGVYLLEKEDDDG